MDTSKICRLTKINTEKNIVPCSGTTSANDFKFAQRCRLPVLVPVVFATNIIWGLPSTCDSCEAVTHVKQQYGDSRFPAESYHWPPSSLVMLSWERRRTHSSGVVWKKRTGSFLTLHHSQLISSDARRFTSSAPISGTTRGRQHAV